MLCHVTISEQLPSELQNIKSDFNFISYALRIFLTKFKMQYSRRRAAYLSPQTIRRSFRILRFGHSCYDWSIPRRSNVSWRHRLFLDVKTHFLPLEHSWTHFLFTREIFRSVFWSKMERKKRKPALTIIASGSTLHTPFCKHVLQLSPTSLPRGKPV